ncbi:MAG: NUDIX domain-containing protein [Candidatus Aenigmarchaeota archaeon]|nr:NUDIX domain-containing protein [Candidatus Aenigmarchaeota archaeon]
MVEFIDIVDENNKFLVMKKKRNDVHKNGDWHRSSHIIIINHKNEVLCNKRSSKKKWFPYHWDVIFGGHVKSGETFETTAISELKEELCIDIEMDELKFIGDFTSNREDKEKSTVNREFIKVYLLQTDKPVDRFEIQEEEVSEIKYIPIKKLIGILKHVNPKMKFIPEQEYYLLILSKIESIVR